MSNWDSRREIAQSARRKKNAPADSCETTGAKSVFSSQLSAISFQLLSD